jgi:hypothetical protein
MFNDTSEEQAASILGVEEEMSMKKWLDVEREGTSTLSDPIWVRRTILLP